jgi:S1-C subfamily serine protease
MVDKMNKIITKNVFVIIPIILLLVLVNGFTSTKKEQINASVIGANSVDDPAGARLESVESMGYASNFGLQVGDIVLSINGQTVKGSDSFLRLMNDIPQDVAVSIQIIRDGVETTVGRETSAGNTTGNSRRERIRHS